MNVNDIVVKDIDTENEYKWIQYGDVSILIRVKDNYVNATKLCKDGGREFFHWTQNKITKQLIEEMSRYLNISKENLMQLVVGGKMTTIRGTYVHPDLIVHIASWLSPKFAVFVSTIVRKWRELHTDNANTFWSQVGESVHDSRKNSLVEKQIQAQIAIIENGIIEVETPHGRIDVLSDSKVIEIKNYENWKHAIGQVLTYSLFYPNKEKWIYLFNHEDETDVNKSAIIDTCNKLGVNAKFI